MKTFRKKSLNNDLITGKSSDNINFQLDEYAEKAIKAKNLYIYGVPVKVICRDLDISRSTLYNYLKFEGLNNNNYIRKIPKATL